MYDPALIYVLLIHSVLFDESFYPSDSIMLYRIPAEYTADNFSTKLNEKMSINDQYYTAQLYVNFIEKDYQHCEKKISCDDTDYHYKLQCYNTWYKSCMVFVRDIATCEEYQNPEAEYLHYIWLKNKTTPPACKYPKNIHYWLHGITTALKSFSASVVESVIKFDSIEASTACV